MPGPILKYTGTNPQPIAPYDDRGGTLGDVANVANAGIQGFEVYQERKQKQEQLETATAKAKYLSSVAQQVQSLETKLNNETVTPGGLIAHQSRVRNIVSSAIQAYPEDASKFMAIGASSRAWVGMQGKQADYRRKTQDELRKGVLDESRKNFLPSTMPMAEQIEENDRIRALNNQVSSDELTIRQSIANGTITKDKQQRAVNVKGAKEYTLLSNQWEDTMHLSNSMLVSSLSTADKIQYETALTSTYNAKIQELISDSAYLDLTEEEIMEGLQPLTFAYNLNINRLNNKITENHYVSATKANQAVAEFLMNSTPESALAFKKLNVLSQADNSLILTIMEDGQVKKEIQKLSALTLGSNSQEPIIMAAKDRTAVNTIRHRLFNNMRSVYEGDPSYSEQNAKDESKMMVSIYKDMNENPTAYHPQMWKESLNMLASPTGAIIAGNPQLSDMASRMRDHLVIMEGSLVTEAGKAGSVRINNDQVVVEGDRTTTIQLNTYLKAKSNLDFITPKEALDEFVKDNPNLFGNASDPTSGMPDKTQSAFLEALEAAHNGGIISTNYYNTVTNGK